MILAGVVLFLVYPFLKSNKEEQYFIHEISEDQEQIDLELERETLLQSLSELEDEKEQGKFTEKDFVKLKSTDEYRLAKVLNRLDELSSPSVFSSGGKKSKKIKEDSGIGWIPALSMGVLVLGASAGIFYYLHWKEDQIRLAIEQRRQMQVQSQGMPNPAEMVARLEKRLKENPNDLEGQIMAGRSYLALNRIEEAKAAWKKVVELDPRNHEAHFNVAVILIETAETGNMVTYQNALAHLEKALIKFPREPALLWYQGLAFVHLQRFSEADESWTTAYQNITPGTKDAEMIKEALQTLRQSRAPQF